MGWGSLTTDKKCPVCSDPGPAKCASYATIPATGAGNKGTCSCKSAR